MRFWVFQAQAVSVGGKKKTGAYRWWICACFWCVRSQPVGTVRAGNRRRYKRAQNACRILSRSKRMAAQKSSRGKSVKGISPTGLYTGTAADAAARASAKARQFPEAACEASAESAGRNVSSAAFPLAAFLSLTGTSSRHRVLRSARVSTKAM